MEAESDKERPPPTRQCNGAKFVAAYLGLPNKRAFLKLTEVPDIKEIFADFEKNVIDPQVALARASGRDQRPRLMNFNAVEAVILNDEGGARNFRRRRPVKDNWTIIDHYAYTVVNLIMEFKSLLDGPLRSKHVSPRMEKNMAWALLKYLSYQETPSRKKLRAIAAAKKEAKRLRKEADEAAQRAEKSQKGTNKKKRKRSKSQAADPIESSPTDRTESNEKGVSEGLSEVDSEGEAAQSALVLPQVDIPDGPTEEEIENDHILVEALLPEAAAAELDAEAQAVITTALSARNVPQEVQQGISEEASSNLTPVQMMLAERRHDTFDLRDRFWQDDYITNVLLNYPDPLKIERGIQHTTDLVRNSVLDVEDTTWQRSLQEAEDEDVDILGLSTTTSEDKERSISNAKLFDNKRYQIQKLNRACNDMGMHSTSRRFDEMPAGANFKFWQPSAMYAMRQFERRGLKGAILGDLMGLGKTWVMLGCHLAVSYLQMMFLQGFRTGAPISLPISASSKKPSHVITPGIASLLIEYEAIPNHLQQSANGCQYNEDRKRARVNREPIPAAKPTLIVAPPDLIEQWKREIVRVCGDSDNTRIIEYHGAYDHTKVIKRHLTRDSEFFNGDDKNARVIILTTPRTLAQRHGPSALQQWRRANGYSAERAKKLRDTPESPRGTWPRDLHGCFRYVLVDEATSVKNVASQSHLAVKFLNPNFTILATGTPDQNRVEDILGLAEIIEPKEKIREVESQYETAEIEGFNPYDEVKYGDDHEIGQILRLKVSNVKTYVTEVKDVATQGKRLAAFLASCMIRRSNSSSFAKFGVIGGDIPEMVTKRVYVNWAEDDEFDEQKKYDEVVGPSLKRLVRKLPDGKVIWNHKYLRRLILASQWTGFDQIEKKLKAEHCAELLDKDDLCAILTRMYAEKNGEAFQEDAKWQLSALLKGSPKGRALLELVRHIVVRNQRKVIIFCQQPAQMVHYKAILQSVGINVACYHAGLSKQQKTRMVDQFNAPIDGPNSGIPTVFLTTIALAGVGLNLQYSCHHVIFGDPPHSQSAFDQGLSRVHRIGQEYAVKGFTLIGRGSFNERTQDNTLRKAAPGALASIDQNLFEFATSVQENGTVELSLNDWVNHNGMLVRPDDESVQGLNLPVLQGYSVLAALLSNRLGEKFRMDDTEVLNY